MRDHDVYEGRAAEGEVVNLTMAETKAILTVLADWSPVPGSDIDWPVLHSAASKLRQSVYQHEAFLGALQREPRNEPL